MAWLYGLLGFLAMLPVSDCFPGQLGQLVMGSTGVFFIIWEAAQTENRPIFFPAFLGWIWLLALWVSRQSCGEFSLEFILWRLPAVTILYALIIGYPFRGGWRSLGR
jgi:hypothetical protein